MNDRTPPRKLGYGPLAVLEWLCEVPEGQRLMVQPSGPGPWLFEAGPPGEDGRRPLRRSIIDSDPVLRERFGGRGSVDVTGLVRVGFAHFQEMQGFRDADAKRAWADLSARYDTGHFGYSHNVWVPGPEAYRYWRETGAPALAALRAARDAERARDERLVVIKAPWTPRREVPEALARMLPKDFRHPLAPRRTERAYAIARVVRQTPTRLYVTDVERLAKGAGWSVSEDPVRNSADGEYVEPSAVMMDGATPRAARALAAIEAEHAAEAEEAFQETLRRIAPALLDLSMLLDQRAARRDDEIREAIEAARAAGDEYGSPEREGPAGPGR